MLRMSGVIPQLLWLIRGMVLNEYEGRFVLTFILLYVGPIHKVQKSSLNKQMTKLQGRSCEGSSCMAAQGGKLGGKVNILN
jgi:hypothetical protein